MESEAGGCYSIVYISTAIAEFGEADLVQLLKRARGFNEQAGITGVLDLLASGRLPERGFVRQEEIALGDFLANRFGRFYDPSASQLGLTG